MGHKTFQKVSATIFSIVALLHGLRLVFGWGVAIGGFEVPLSWSIVGLLAAGFLGWTGFKLSR